MDFEQTKPSAKELYSYHNSLAVLLKAIEGEKTIVDLRNESYVYGKIEQADGFMNVVVKDCLFTDPRGDKFLFDTFFVHARNIRCVHIPSNVVWIRKVEKMSSYFRIEDYDCIGFDLDNTLLEYKIANLVKLEYETVSRFLVEQKGYDPEYLYKPLTEDAVDFMQKGLILDFERGNILKISAESVIVRASHGTKPLKREQIQEIYPNNGRWEAVQQLANDPMVAWNGPLSLKVRALLDYFDMPLALIFGRAVDAIDDSANLTTPITKPAKYNIWPDIYTAAVDMYDREQFKKNAGHFFPQLKKHPDKYLRKCSDQIINWLKRLKENNNKKLTFLITGSNGDFADFTATYAIGADWKSLFDVVVCFAKKPGFFTENRAFWSTSEEDYQEREIIPDAEIVRGGIYSQGNWNGLKNLLARISDNPSPKCLYIGDNLIQDVYVPSKYCGLDTVVVSEEFHGEASTCSSIHPDQLHLVSRKYWGSYFFLPNHSLTHWSNYIKRYSKICIPSINFLAECAIDQSFEAFDQAGNDNDTTVISSWPGGFYPPNYLHFEL